MGSVAVEVKTVPNGPGRRRGQELQVTNWLLHIILQTDSYLHGQGLGNNLRGIFVEKGGRCCQGLV